MTLAKLARTLEAYKSEKSLLETRLAETNKHIQRAEAELAGAMIEQEVPFFAYQGRRYTLDTRTTIRPVKEYADAVVDWIVRNGGESLVKPAMHWNTRNKFLEESFLDDDGNVAGVPPELDGRLVVDTQPRVSTRTL